MEGAADIAPPFLPGTTSGSHLRRTSFQFLSSDAFAIFFLIVSLCFIFVVVVSPFYCFSGHFFRPHSARKSWDFLSLALVLFAIACGLLSRNNGDNTVHEEVYRTSNASEQNQKSNPSTPLQWHGYSDRTDQILLHHPPEVAGNEYWRISGGPSMINYPYPGTDSHQHCRNLQEFEEELDVKRVARATFSVCEEEVSSSSSPLHQFSVPPLMTPQHCAPPVRAPTPPGVVETEVERRNETVGQCEDGDGNLELPSLQLAFQPSEDEISKNEKERGAERKELSSSLKRRKKKKTKEWQKSVENFNNLPGPKHHYRNLSPPPAPVAVHHYQTSSNIDETRKDCLVPPQSSSKKLIAAVPSAAKADAHRTPTSSRAQNSIGRQPPSFPLPPQELQIVMHGEYIGTTNETGSPNPEVNEGFKSKKASRLTNALPTTNENAERKGPMFCASPDVNSKADSFIERFRAGLKLERMNSIKERQRKRTSILGR